jgi:hypothetical protein
MGHREMNGINMTCRVSEQSGTKNQHFLLVVGAGVRIRDYSQWVHRQSNR